SKRKKKSFNIFKTYKAKTLFYFSFLITVVFAAGFFFTIFEFQKNKIETTANTIDHFANYLRDDFAVGLSKKDTSALTNSIYQIIKFSDLEYAVSINYKGQIFHYYNLEKAESNIYLVTSKNNKIDLSENIFKKVLQIENDEKNIAELYVGFSIVKLKEEIKGEIFFILPYFGGGWLFCLLIVFLIINKTFKPFKKVIETTREMMDGDYTKRIDIKDKTELGRLGKAINYLIENLEQGQSQISKMDAKLKGAFKEKIGELNLEINQRRIAEKSVRISEKQFRLLFDIAPIGMAKISIEGQISQINNSFCETLGYNDIDLIDNDITKFIVEEDLKIFKNLQRSLIEKATPKETIEICFKKRDGKIINTLLKSALVEDEKGVPVNFIIQVIDITQQKETEKNLIVAREKAEESDRLKTAFLAQMSHEIRTPLNVILNTTVILEDDIDPELLDAVNHAGKRLQRTIDLILNMSAIQSGSYDPEFETIDLDKELKIMVNEFKGICKEKNLEIEYLKETDNANIVGDNYTVMQIFQNLIGNAVKYTPKGTVKVILKNGQTDLISVEVKDTGIGISDEYLENIFQPFSQE
ncbi:MAG: hypothetical protein COW08_08860, partial [Ignavibacteriales bacterium CG12_big_fil_rev_8_21_14_0_65_30_8]